MNIFIYLLAGALGSLVKDVLTDGKLKLPRVIDGELLLGFVGGMIVGAFVGVVVDGSFLTAFMGGFVGISVISNLIPKNGQSSTGGHPAGVGDILEQDRPLV